jgi:hypothetical protein
MGYFFIILCVASCTLNLLVKGEQRASLLRSSSHQAQPNSSTLDINRLHAPECPSGTINSTQIPTRGTSRRMYCFRVSLLAMLRALLKMSSHYLFYYLNIQIRQLAIQNNDGDRRFDSLTAHEMELLVVGPSKTMMLIDRSAIE